MLELSSQLQGTARPTHSARRHKLKRDTKIQRCNICHHRYEASSRFQRFCTDCRQKSALFHFAEWVPELPEVIDLSA